MRPSGLIRGRNATPAEVRRWGVRGCVERGLAPPPIQGGAGLRLADGMDYELAGANEATTQGVAATSGGANTKGAWAQLTASTARDATGLYMLITNGSNTASLPSKFGLVDIGIGAAGSEQVLVPNLQAHGVWMSGGTYGSPGLPGGYYVPVAVPAGARLSARYSESVAGANTITVYLILVEEGLASQPGFTRVTDYGTVTATSQGTLVSTGATNVKGSWTQLTASSTNPCSALLVAMWGRPNGGDVFMTDIGVGAAGAEQLVAGDLWQASTFQGGGSANSPPWNAATYVLPASIPAGSRIAARNQDYMANNGQLIIVYGLD